jgi:hypothetical protein
MEQDQDEHVLKSRGDSPRIIGECPAGICSEREVL